MNTRAPNASAGVAAVPTNSAGPERLAETRYKELAWSLDLVPTWELLPTQRRDAWGRVASKARDELTPAPRFAIDEREFRFLYSLFQECLKVRARGVQQWNRIPPAMRLAVVELIQLYRGGEWPVLRAVDFKDGLFVSNGKGAGL